jgi:light-regulated signal transduction histidine kinase (bacteriophytochrome)
MNDLNLNKLLLKQISKKYGDINTMPKEMRDLLGTISQTYDHYEREMQLIERSMDLSSEEMKEIYNKLELQKSQLENSNDALRRYAFIVSHDLKEPLRTISSYLQLIELRLGDKLDGETREFMDFSVNAVKRMKGMLEAVLDYSQLESRMSFGNVDLEMVFRSSFENLQEIISETDTVIMKKSPLPKITGDRFQLIQLFQNLVHNSIKFRGNTNPNITIEYYNSPYKHLISIMDNGIGIPEKNRQQVFQLFRRLHTIDKYEGLGMGLAICKKIVENHHGEINIDPGFDHGLKIDISFPKAA